MIKLYRPIIDIKSSESSDSKKTYYASWVTLSPSFISQPLRLLEFKNKCTVLYCIEEDVNLDDIDKLDVNCRYIELNLTPLSDIWNKLRWACASFFRWI